MMQDRSPSRAFGAAIEMQQGWFQREPFAASAGIRKKYAD